MFLSVCLSACLFICQVPDSDADDLGVVFVSGKSMRAPTLALELSISQITGAARPALGCKVSPRLAQRGCELVVSLVREVSTTMERYHTIPYHTIPYHTIPFRVSV